MNSILFKGIKSSKEDERGCLLIAEMSSKGNLITDQYVKGYILRI